MGIREDAHRMKIDAPQMAAATIAKRNHALDLVAQELRAHADEIFAANAADMSAACANGVSNQVKKRLRFDDHKLADVSAGIDQLISLSDPVGHITLDRELDSGLELRRVTCPIGVIGVIFEARPDALVQISTLCLKSGNCAILKGGRETAHTNRKLFALIRDAAIKAGLPPSCLMQVESHADVNELLACDGDIDLLIPRGSNAFVRYIMDHTRIPVMGHADGICHVYVDVDAELDEALRIVMDSKTQYAAVCNAAETILVARPIAAAFLPRLDLACQKAHVVLRGDAEVRDYITDALELTESGYGTEYLDLCASVKVVADVDEAIAHINRWGSHHTDAICTANEATAARFCQMVDSAGVYVNASTRFADGFRYGFGAEVGISTGKMPPRGPVGLEGLVTYKYLLYGHGDIVADYASGKRHFRHIDLV